MPRGEGPWLVKAAIRMEDGTVHTGCRHCNIFYDIAKAHPGDEEMRLAANRAEQGFVDEDGTFYGRPAALTWAIYIGQIPSERCLIGSVLTSEDLWENDFTPVVHKDPGPDREDWKAAGWR